MQGPNASERPGLIAPTDWPWAKAAAPAISSDKTLWQGALLRSWSGTSSVMVQPPLDHHYVVMHLGGPKRVNRRHDGPPTCALAECGSLTVVPAGTAYVWKTEGPIAFVHLYLRPQQLARCGEQTLERDGRGLDLIDDVACRDHWLELIFGRMLEEIRCQPEPSRLLLDSLLDSFCIRLAQKHMSTPPGKRMPQAESLAPYRLRRVLDFIDANLGLDIELADLVAAAGTSQYHFSRAFHLATGLPPYRYLVHRRVEYARVLLLTTDVSLSAISARCGFNSPHQFAVMFKRSVGIGPKRFRLVHAAPVHAGVDGG